MLVLGIESSCDETAAAVVGEGGRSLSDVIASQDEIHSAFGGVVPELAARAHMERVQPVIREALSRAGVGVEDIEGVAVTSGPGLSVCLLVGIQAAKGIALGLGIPLVGVNHLEGHLLASFIDGSRPPPEYPFIGLVASGGHTSLYLASAPGKYKRLGHTLDDAAGEAFDKTAKVLGLPYPGGREIQVLAERGDPRAIDFPRPLLARPGYDFSFSGLKTAVINYVAKMEGELNRADVAASFQAAAVELLVAKTTRAARELGVPRIVVSGGVAANRLLREEFEKAGSRELLQLWFPGLRLCTDNAAMIAHVGRGLLKNGGNDGPGLAPRAVWPL